MNWLREQKLIHLVTLLWNQLTLDQQHDLEPSIHAHKMDWAIPLVEHVPEGEKRLFNSDRLTTEQVARECGVTASTVRDWKKRHKLKQVNGYFVWGDIVKLRQKQNLWHANRRAS